MVRGRYKLQPSIETNSHPLLRLFRLLGESQLPEMRFHGLHKVSTADRTGYAEVRGQLCSGILCSVVDNAGLHGEDLSTYIGSRQHPLCVDNGRDLCRPPRLCPVPAGALLREKASSQEDDTRETDGRQFGANRLPATVGRAPTERRVLPGHAE